MELLQFGYAITGDNPPWRPLRAFDDGRQTFIEFPASIAVGEAPPLFVLGPTGDAQLVNYRVSGRFYVVDRLFGAAWVALKPATFRIVAGSDNRGDAGTKTPADALANAPKSYGDVPQLGTPLPGDLGRPILEHQRSIGAALPPAGPDQAAQAAEAERQRVAAERKAARESGVMMQLSGANRPATASAEAAASASPPASEGEAKPRVALDPERDPNGQQRKADFLAGKDERGDINPHALVPPISPYTVMAGSIISASLITGLNSDLPGLVTAQVTENVQDSVTGRIVLIPQGSRLIGSYDSVVAFGQKRALVVWQRIILPDGSSIRIDNVPATDTAGYAGAVRQGGRPYLAAAQGRGSLDAARGRD